MTRLAEVSEISVPRRCVNTIMNHLRGAGHDGHEGLGLWVGRPDGSRFDVTEALIPRQIHRRTEDGVCVILAPDGLHELNVWLYRHKLTLIAQIHSHPGRAYHSGTDDAYAVATTVGCVSIVVPNFARAAFEMARVATYRLNEQAQWVELPPARATTLVRIED